jgi:hypothetical protein
MKAITTKVYPSTETKSSRITASDLDGNRISIRSDLSTSDDGHDMAAIALCRKKNWNGVLVRGAVKEGNVYVFLDDSALVQVPKADQLLPYPEPLRTRSGNKVAWNIYASEEEARVTSRVAVHNASIKEKQGYDFGFCSPGSIKKLDSGEFEVCIP